MIRSVYPKRTAVIIAAHMPGDTTGHRRALRCSLEAYEQHFSRLEYVAVTARHCEVATGLYSRTNFHVVHTKPRSLALRFARALFSRYPGVFQEYLSASAIGLLRGVLNEATSQADNLTIICEHVPPAGLLECVGIRRAQGRVVLRSHDALGRAFAQVAAGKKPPQRWLWSMEARRILAVERRLVTCADAVWCITDQDADAYESDFGRRPDAVFGVYADLDRYAAVGSGDDTVAVHVGSVDARKGPGIQHLTARVWPAVRRACPQAQLILAGAGAEQFHNPERGVTGIGPVKDDAATMGRGTIFINPQTTGAGLKIKSVNALAAGRLLVTTPTGIQGIQGRRGCDFLVGNSDAEMCDAIVWAIRNPSAAREIARAGRLLASRQFSTDIYFRSVTTAIERFQTQQTIGHVADLVSRNENGR